MKQFNMKAKYLNHKKCNFCKSSNKVLRYRLGVQNMVQCSNCMLVYVDKQRVDLEGLYNESYYKADEGNSRANYMDYQNRKELARKNFSFAYDYISSNSKGNKKTLLEIGAGFGYFLALLPKSIHCSAIEISKEAVEEIKRNTNAKVYKGDFLDTHIRNKFNFIVSFDVIEHQVFLLEYLKKIHSLLKTNSVFAFTTPDFGSPLNKVFGKHAPAIQPLYHNYYFDKNWIKKNVPQLGYEIIYIKTVYIAEMDLGYIFVMTSFIIPIIYKMGLFRIIKKINVEKIKFPFFRLGGIECILRKI